MYRRWVTVGTAGGVLGVQACIHSAEEAQLPGPKRAGRITEMLEVGAKMQSQVGQEGEELMCEED